MPAGLAQWCAEHLGSAPVAELFRSGHLATVVGLVLADGREVVVKLRPAAPRIAGCVEVQRRLFAAGYPCPEPLTGAFLLGDEVATAEAYVAGGEPVPAGGDPARAFADAFSELVRFAPRPADVPALDPVPSWADWDHAQGGLWPRSEEADVDLNAVAGPAWIDATGRQARDRLRAGQSEVVIGHCDWLADNLRWTGDKLLVLHDWDSAIAESEPVLVGLAAALYPGTGAGGLAAVADTERFLTAYCAGRGQDFSADERERCWAAGVWTRAYDAKFQHATGHPVVSLSEPEARERLHRASPA